MSTVIKKIKVGEILYDIIDTDTKVTDVGKHYTPKADESVAISVDASSTTSANWNVTSLVTGVNIQRDKAGHVTGVTLDSVKMPSNPNTDVNCSEGGHYTPKTEKSDNKQSAETGKYISAIKLDSKKHVVGIDTSSLPTFTESYKGTVKSITPGVGLKLNGKDDGDSTSITSSGTIDLQKASNTELGGIKIGYSGTGKNYAVQLDTSDAAYVNVPWSDTNTHYISKNIVAASTRSTSNGAVTDNGVYLNHLEESTIKSTHKITGSGSVKVTSDASGNITITGTDTNTTYNVVGAKDTTGLIKNGSSVTSTTGYTTCPIVNGVPYYKDTNTTYTAGANITISGTTISAKDTTYTAGTNITISGTTISAKDTTYTAGTNITISNGVISAKDTTYTAGTNITISGGVISAIDTTYSVVGAKDTTGLIKNGSSVTSTTGYTTCPIVNGVPYYKNTTYSVVSTKDTTGLVKNGSTVTSTTGYTACPIVSGVPYYKDTNTTNTAGATTTSSKIYLIGATTSGTNPQTYTNLSVHATNGELTAKSYIVTGSASSTNKITSDASYNMYFSIGSKTPLVLANDGSSNVFVAPGSSYSGVFDLGTGNRRWKNVYASGQMYATGGFYETSDETLKNFSNPINIDLDKLSNIKKNYFTWKNSENKEQQIGVSAQEIRELYPEIVSEQEDGILTVAYDKLSVIALAAIDKLYQENKDLKERLIALENKLK